MGTSAVSAPVGSSPAAAIDGLRRSDSGADLRLRGGVLPAGMRRSRSEPQLRCAAAPVSRSAAGAPARLRTSRSVGIFPFRSFLFDAEEEAAAAMRLVDSEEADEIDEKSGKEKKANWVGRLLELRTRWRDRQQQEAEAEAEQGEELCGVRYESEEEEREEWDREAFARVLAPVAWPDAKLFAQLAFLCNLAYFIPEIKAEELRRYYGLWFVTSSLEKKLEAAAIKTKLETDSTRPPPDSGRGSREGSGPICVRPSVAYEIAASAASYIHSRAKGLLSLGDGPVPCCEEADPPETRGEGRVAACVAASTITAVVAAEEEAKLEAAKDLRSLHSSPCEWFVCDEPGSCTRCFVIQGSESLASWQANLFFEPTKFEATEVMVHRGIYEAAKGIYEQFMPEIQAHLRRHGERARFRFTGHSLGGSLALLVHLMLLARGVVRREGLLPVVTFGSPSVFCGGRRMLEELGLEESDVRSVIMHRDIVPRAFSCSYPNHVAQVLKRLNGAFRSHTCLNNEKVLYSPLGQTYILQPDEKSSPPHPLLPPEAALYAVDAESSSKASASSAMRAFLNTPHPLETLSDPRAYGSEGTIIRDHDSANYLKAINALVRQHTKSVVRRSRKQRLNQWWPLLTTAAAAPHGAPRHHDRGPSLAKPGLVTRELVTRV